MHGTADMTKELEIPEHYFTVCQEWLAIGCRAYAGALIPIHALLTRWEQGERTADLVKEMEAVQGPPAGPPA